MPHTNRSTNASSVLSSGRTGLYELMVNNEAISEQVMARASSSKMIAAAKASGLRLLREDGWDKVRAGMTTPEEVVRSTKG